MKEKLLIFLALAVLIIVLIGLNAASYVQKEQIPDSETAPNRSSYNVGATGTRAFYDLLAETGRPVTRWQDPPPSAVDLNKENHPQTFVVIGGVRREFEESEMDNLLDWVYYDGGRLVIIDRAPPAKLLTTESNWQISAVPGEMPFLDTDPANQQQMTTGTDAFKPTQPTLFTEQVNAVQPSRFASSVQIQRVADGEVPAIERARPDDPVIMPPGPPIAEPTAEDEAPPTAKPDESADPVTGGASDRPDTVFAEPTPVKMDPAIKPSPEAVPEDPPLTAPVIHLAGGDNKNILLDHPYGAGQIVFLTDPYIVSNSGIGLVDNARLAVNIVSRNDGLIAFDEYHQGFGSNNNLLVNYFEGTPVIAILLQLGLLIGFVFYTQSRRFARAVPATEPDRLSKLEYVGAMAALQERTGAFDLAIENIYKDLRRRVSKLLGVDNFTTPRTELAELIAERSKLDAKEIDDLMFKCEDITHGEPTNKKETLNLIARLRELENELGLRRGKGRR